jgi:hypothetical protein
MLGSYNTLSSVSAILGMSEDRVLEEIVNGPLVAVRRESGLMVHDDDLAAYRRPRSATSVSGGISALCKLVNGIQPRACCPSDECERS